MSKKPDSCLKRKKQLEKEFSTIGEKYGPAMKIKTREEAAKYFKKLVEHSMLCFGTSKEYATALEKRNLGYFAGYYDKKTADRVFKLFDCAHPIFGTMYPTPKKAITMGIRLKQRRKQ